MFGTKMLKRQLAMTMAELNVQRNLSEARRDDYLEYKQKYDDEHEAYLALESDYRDMRARALHSEDNYRAALKTIDKLTDCLNEMRKQDSLQYSKILEARDDYDALNKQYKDLEKTFQQLQAKFRIVDGALGRVTKQRDKAQCDLEGMRANFEIAKEDAEHYHKVAAYLGSIMSKMLAEPFFNGKRVLIKEKEFEELLVAVEKATGVPFGELCSTYATHTNEEVDDE